MQSYLYPNTEVYEPMLISKTPSIAKLEKELASGNYIAQPKKDGYFYQLVKNKAGEIFLFSRSKSRKTNFFSEKIECVPHIKEWAQELPCDTILIGEVYYPGKKSNDTTRIMGCLPKTAIARQKGEYGPIHYYVHDILKYAGQDYLETGFEYRYDSLLTDLGDLFSQGKSFMELAPACSQAEELDGYIANLLDAGEEGAVVKMKSGLYVPGKRPTYNFKIKQQCDGIDLIITELLNPEVVYTGKELDSWPYWETCEGLATPVTKAHYYGWKGAMAVSGYKDGKLISVGHVASGLTDAMKKSMAEHPEEYLGKVVELQAMSWTKDGALRHPRFIRMRPDKNAEECILEV